jgi:smad nuclear-interacting protein 1
MSDQRRRRSPDARDRSRSPDKRKDLRENRSRSPPRRTNNRSGSPDQRKDRVGNRSHSPVVKRENRSRSPDRRNNNNNRGRENGNRSRSPIKRENRSRSPDTRKEFKRERPDNERPGGRQEQRPGQKRFRSQEKPVDESKMSWGKKDEESSSIDEEDKEKPNFQTSGLLSKGNNTIRGVEAKYVESPDAEKPKLKWRLYPFKGEKALDKIEIYSKSHFLLGKDRHIVEICLDHPSCSRQHSVIQFRNVEVKDEDGPIGSKLKINKPYIMDLGSTNGTHLNGSKIDPMRYIELLEKDVLKFGNSSREYVLLHDGTH